MNSSIASGDNILAADLAVKMGDKAVVAGLFEKERFYSSALQFTVGDKARAELIERGLAFYLDKGLYKSAISFAKEACGNERAAKMAEELASESIKNGRYYEAASYYMIVKDGKKVEEFMSKWRESRK